MIKTCLLLAAMFASMMSSAACENTVPKTDFLSHSWGYGPSNLRFQPDTAIDASNVGQLELAWSWAYSSNKPRSWPLVTSDTIFVGDSGRGIVALDKETGCVRWERPHKGEIASAILPLDLDGRPALLFTDRTQGVYVIDANDGSAIWHRAVTHEPLPFYSGTPLVHAGMVYVPLSSLEIGIAANPLYACCSTSGGMAALDALTGEERWYYRTIEQPARATSTRWFVIEEKGPSGAPVWGSPTLDTRYNLLLFGTGQNYSHPTTSTSDSIIALDASTGARRWVMQATSGDAYNIACNFSPNYPTCPKPMGPDVDFGAPPIALTTPAGQDVVLAGQKSGDLYALAPETGEVIWHSRIGRGGALGGIHWGLAANPSLGLLYVPVSDIAAMSGASQAEPGLHAVDVTSGEVRWRHERQPRCPERRCSPGISAAISATPELVITGSLDGWVEAFEATTGELMWQYDTWQPLTAVNGGEIQGGAIDAHGPMVAGDSLIISSGYNSFGQPGGNALLVFRLREKQ